jgi:hypothetical protein
MAHAAIKDFVEIPKQEYNLLKNRLTIFKDDIFDKRLKTHHLKGNLKEYYAFSIRRMIRFCPFHWTRGRVIASSLSRYFYAGSN